MTSIRGRARVSLDEVPLHTLPRKGPHRPTGRERNFALPRAGEDAGSDCSCKEWEQKPGTRAQYAASRFSPLGLSFFCHLVTRAELW